MPILRLLLLGFCVIALLAGTAIFIFFPFITVFQIIFYYVLVLAITTLLDKLVTYITRKVPALQSSSDTKQKNSSEGHIYNRNQRSQDRQLYSVESVWPFMLFPDKLIIEEEDVIIIRKKFFSASSSETILIKDIFSLIINTGPIFASLVVQRKTNIPGTEARIMIHYLPKKEALIAKELMDGLLLEKSDSVKFHEDAPIEQRRQELIAAGRNDTVASEL